MNEELKLRPMPNVAFRPMVWMMSLMDLFSPSGVGRRLAKIPLKEGMTVVDYACGPGRYTIPIAEIVGPKGKVYAVDIQPLAIETVRKKASHKHLSNIEALLVDSYHTGIPDASADAVLLVDMIHGIRDRESLFQEVHRLLKPGSLLFMDVEHTSISRVKDQVALTGLFKMIQSEGRDMLFRKA